MMRERSFGRNEPYHYQVSVMMKLNRDFFLEPDVLHIAKSLLGKVLVTNIDGLLTSGVICETEAYAGISDKASHAYGGRRTSRTDIMFREGGLAYVYLCYGIHSLFNVVTNIEGVPHAVLIRGIQALDGLPVILQRLDKSLYSPDLTNGPGKVSKALGIHYTHSGLDLMGSTIWLEDRAYSFSSYVTTSRIGVDYAGDHALLPYRFLAKYPHKLVL